ncbi:FimD/PapC N-terminal domain-containing protein, partial [Enterobacter cloacae complex sp. P4RS]
DIIKDISLYIPDANYDFNFSKQSLNISIPQAFVTPEARNSVSSDLWDDGIPAALFSYGITGSNTYSNEYGNNNNYFVNMRSG